MKVDFYKNIKALKYQKIKNRIDKEINDSGLTWMNEVLYCPEYNLLFSLDYLWQQSSRFLNGNDLPTLKKLFRKLFVNKQMSLYRGIVIGSDVELTEKEIEDKVNSENREFISCTTNIDIAKQFSVNAKNYITLNKKYNYSILLNVVANKCHEIEENDMGEDEVVASEYKLNIIKIQEI